MQTNPESFIQLAAIRHAELQAEAARVRRAEHARAHKATLLGILSTLRRGSWTAIVNAALRLHGLATTAGGGSPAVSVVRADSLSSPDGVAS